MVTTGLVLLGVGLLLVLIGVRMAGSAMSITGHKILTAPLPLGQDVEAGPAKVDAQSPCRVVVDVKLESSAVDESTFMDRTRYKAKFRFPFRCRILDEGGSVVHEMDTEVSWEAGDRCWSGCETSEGGKIRTQVGLEEFTPSKPGALRAEARLDEDEEFGARAQGARLVLLDRTDAGGSLAKALRGMVFIALGPLLLLAGIIVLIIGLLT